MTNQKLIEITAINYDIYVFCEEFNIYYIEEIRYLAKAHQMKCLPFIDTSGCTFFNSRQCDDIKKELEILKDYDIDIDLYDFLFRIIIFIEKNGGYIKLKAL